jgi:hypothetical protein
MEDLGSNLLCLISGFVVLIIITAPFYLLWRKRRRNELAKESADDVRAARSGPTEQVKLEASRKSKRVRNILVVVLIGCVLFMLLFARNLYPLLTSPQDITLEQLHTMGSPTANWHDYRIDAGTITNTGVQYYQYDRDTATKTYYTYFIIRQGDLYLVVDSEGNPDHLQLPVVGRLFTMSSNDRSRLAGSLPKNETVLPYVLQVRHGGYFLILIYIALGGVIVFILFILITNRLDILESVFSSIGNMIKKLSIEKLFL